MKRRILKMVKILTAYILLNIGVLSWIEVSEVSESRLSTAQTVMAEIKTEPDNMIEISLGDRKCTLDLSVPDSLNVRTLLLFLGEPAVIALWNITI